MGTTTEEKPLALPVKEMPLRIRGMLQISHPTATGLVVEEVASDQNVEQLGEQFKTKGYLITAYMHRGTIDLLFRVVDTNNNWKTTWYKTVGFVTQ